MNEMQLQNRSTDSRFSLTVRYSLGLSVVLALSLAAFYLGMRPTLGDLGLLSIVLGFTAGIAGLTGYLAYRRGWLEQMPSLRVAIFGGYVLASSLSFIAVWLMARLMFTSLHDLQLATVLLVFAGGMAVVLGYFLASTHVRRIQLLRYAAERLADGDFSARTAVKGRDEIAALGASFNSMAARLQEAETRRQELDRLRRDLVAWAGHDLQTPLTSIRLQVEALADGMVDDPDMAQRYLRSTQRQVNELSLLLDDLFQMAQVDAGGLVVQKASCSLPDLISDTLESFSALAEERDVVLSGQTAPDVDLVEIDAPRLGRALNNLISNALRHTRPGGSVVVSARRDTGLLIIEVADTGEGIAAEDLPHIFERFYRGEKSRSRETGGAGLGLAIAEGIVRAHGGKIQVESRLGEKTVFQMLLPG